MDDMDDDLFEVVLRPCERQFVSIFKPDYFGKYSLLASAECFPEEEIEGVQSKDRDGVVFVRVSTKIPPPIYLENREEHIWAQQAEILKHFNRSPFDLVKAHDIAIHVRKYHYNHPHFGAGYALSLLSVTILNGEKK